MRRPIAANIRALTLAVAIVFLLVSVGVGYWTLVASETLAADPFNPRLIAAQRDMPRGAIVDRTGQPLAQSVRRGDDLVREYRDRSLAQVVGYASFKYGATGIEQSYAESLIGQDPADPVGLLRARYLGERGAPSAVVLGIDARVQSAAASALAGRRGAVVAMDPRTGLILASVSLPNYDANLIVDPAQQDIAWGQVNGNADRPLLDRVTQGLYPPGSVFKLITTAAGLENGLDPNARIRVDDPFQADRSWGDYFVRSSSHAHGDFDLSLAYQRSENIYFAKVGLQVGGPRLADYARRFGIGTRPKLDLDERAVAAGQVSTSGVLDRPTLVADTSFGQGELLVSPLQMLLVTAAIADRGSLPAAHYASEVRDGQGRRIRSVDPAPVGQVIRAETARTITQAMVDAVEAPGAFAAGAKIAGVKVAGKTGTAENAAGSPHGWFVGFAPAADPTVAVAVLIENAQAGGLDAAPVGGAVLKAALGAGN
ncbi:MAG: penicillin-binding transpeptidase domain-containing protein [Chloroflexota bacterium]|nr:penicillin-binding transpeptidase domain-containing protein [Chloroflexota bacterium]